MAHQLGVIQGEALAAAEMHLAGMANVRGSHTLLGLATALRAVSVLANEFRIVILGQCWSMQEARSALVRPLLGRQLLEQFVHELLTEAQLPRMLLPFRPELKGVDDAHVEQPPGQARPRSTRFASRWRRGVLPAAG